MNYLFPIISVLLGFSVILGIYLARDSKNELKNRKDLLIICKKLLKIIDVSHPQQSDAFFLIIPVKSDSDSGSNRTPLESLSSLVLN